MERNPDNGIIDRVLAGDTEAYHEIISRYGDQVFSLVSGIVRNRQDAEEIVSDVFLKVFSQLHKFRGDSKFSTWLYRIAYNTAISGTRRKREATTDIDERRMESIPEDEEEILLKEARMEQLEHAMEKLPAAERVLIELFYMQDMAIDDISVVTEDTPGNVKVKLFRTRRKLAGLIGQVS